MITISKINFYYASDCKPCKIGAMRDGASAVREMVSTEYSQDLEINFINGDENGDEFGKPLRISPHVVFFDSLNRVRFVVNGFPIIDGDIGLASTELIEYVLLDAIINVEVSDNDPDKVSNISKLSELKNKVGQVVLSACGSLDIEIKKGSGLK